MGCGQSKIHLYPRKSKSKANGKKSGHADTDADADEEEGHIDGDAGVKEINRDKDSKIDNTDNNLSEDKDSPDAPNGEISVSLIRAKNLSLLQSQEISSSQQNFFKMLDQKIHDGPDYDSNSETEIALEEARLNALVQHWESASLTASLCSSASRSLQTTPVRQVPITTTARPPPPLRTAMNSLANLQQPLSADLLPHHATATPPGMVMSQHQLLQHQQIQQQINNSIGQPQQYIISGGVMVPQSQILAKNMNISPKRVDPRTAITMVSQSGNVIQTYPSQQQQPMMTPQQQQQQYQQQMLLISSGNSINSSTSPGVSRPGQHPSRPGQQVVSIGPPGGLPSHLQMTTQYYGQPQSYFGEVLHPMQVPQAPPEYRFPPAISVQRLAPQVQRQLRETQELIKDSCPQLYAAGYGSPGPPMRSQQRNSRQRPSLETTYSTELS